MKRIYTTVFVSSDNIGSMVKIEQTTPVIHNLGALLQRISSLLSGYVCVPGKVTIEIETEQLEE